MMQKEIIKQVNKGFTLVEMLIVVALLAISVGVTSDLLVTLIRGYNKTQVANELEQQASFITLKLEKDIRNALKITSPSEYSNYIILEKNVNGSRQLFVYSATASAVSSSKYVFYRTPCSDVSDCQNKVATKDFDNALTYDGQGGVLFSCNFAGNTCFRTTGTSPQVVSFSFNFTQSQSNAAPVFSGSLPIANTVVVRNSYYLK